MKLSDYKIGVRLGAGITVLLVLTVSMVALSLWGTRKLDSTGDLLNDAMHRSLSAMQWQGNLDSHMEIISAFLRTSDAGEQKRIEAKVKVQTALSNEIRASLEKQANDEEKRMLAAIVEAANKYRDIRTRALEIKSHNRPDDAQRLDALIASELRPSMQAYIDGVKRYGDYADHQADAAGAEKEKASTLVYRIMVLGGILVVALGALLGRLVTRSITRPLAYAVKVAGIVAGGDLTQRIETAARDETGQLLEALRTMNASLANTVGHIRSGAETISTAVTQIAAGNTDLSSRTEQQAASLEQTAAAMEELASTVKQNADNARQANRLAIGASDVASRGGAAVADVVATMNALSASSSKISEIASVIDGIAFQTNILALNAAVEAARAGEQGKGFAVVAGEVRSLAQRSAQAAKEVKALIETSVEKVAIGAQQVERAGATMQEIVGSVTRVTDIMGQITSASEEQAAGIDQVNRAVAQMDESTQQNAALVEEAAAASGALQDQARELVQLVSTFKTADADVRARKQQAVAVAAAGPRGQLRLA